MADEGRRCLCQKKSDKKNSIISEKRRKKFLHVFLSFFFSFSLSGFRGWRSIKDKIGSGCGNYLPFPWQPLCHPSPFPFVFYAGLYGNYIYTYTCNVKVAINPLSPPFFGHWPPVSRVFPFFFFFFHFHCRTPSSLRLSPHVHAISVLFPIAHRTAFFPPSFSVLRCGGGRLRGESLLLSSSFVNVKLDTLEPDIKKRGCDRGITIIIKKRFF